jgi:ATP-dependent Clp protease ATP-binding subunit ClpC
VFERFSTAGRRAVYSARREAGLVGSKIIGSEHLLLGLLRVDPATFEFIPQPVTLVSLRRAAVRWHMPGEKLLNSMDLPISEDVKLAFNNAVSLAEAHGSSFVRTEHLLLALTTVPNSHAAVILEEAGASIALLKQLVSGRQDPGDQQGVELSSDDLEFLIHH